MRRREPPRVLGPYAERNRYRLVIIEDGARKSLYIADESEALRLKADITKQLERPRTRTILEMFEEYFVDKVQTGKCLDQTAVEQRSRLLVFLGNTLEQDVSALTPRRAAALYQRATEMPTEKTGQPLSAASHRNYLALAKAFMNWAVKKGYVTENPFKNVQPIGKVNVGKKQLRIDEARRFTQTALRLYQDNEDILAVAAMVALMMGMRASEVLNRVVRDVDDGGRILWIDSGKTHNARRHLKVPDVLQPCLLKLTANKGPEEFLFGTGRTGKPRKRQLLNGAVARICKQADVPVVCPHSLRGLYATLAVESGAVSDAVAASLGHGSFAMTERHYAQHAAVSGARTARVLSMLDGSATESRVLTGTVTSVVPISQFAGNGAHAGNGAPPVSAEQLLGMLDPATLARLVTLANQRLGGAPASASEDGPQSARVVDEAQSARRDG